MTIEDINRLLDNKLTAFAHQLGGEIDKKLDSRFLRMEGRLSNQIGQGHEEIKQVVISTIEGYMEEQKLAINIGA